MLLARATLALVDGGNSEQKKGKRREWPWLVGIGVAAILLLGLAFGVAFGLGAQASNFVAALSALSAIALAVLTAVLLVLNRELIDANRALAVAGQRQADAAEKTLDELRAQRDEERARYTAAVTPHVIFKSEGISGSRGGPTGVVRLRVSLTGGAPVSDIQLARKLKGTYLMEDAFFERRNAAGVDWSEVFIVDWDTRQDRDWDVLIRFTNALGERVTFLQVARATPQPAFDLEGGAVELQREKPHA